MTAYNFFVMGQICVAYDYRGRGIFGGLYEQLKASMSSSFDVVITEVASRNQRPLRAHEKVGFQEWKPTRLLIGSAGRYYCVSCLATSNPL